MVRKKDAGLGSARPQEGGENLSPVLTRKFLTLLLGSKCPVPSIPTKLTRGNNPTCSRAPHHALADTRTTRSILNPTLFPAPLPQITELSQWRVLIIYLMICLPMSPPLNISMGPPEAQHSFLTSSANPEACSEGMFS